MRILTYVVAIAVTAGMLHSCVPARKLEETEAKKKQCEDELTKIKSGYDGMEKQLKDVTAELSETKKRQDALVRDTSIMGTSLRVMKTQYDKINDLNREIQRQLDALRKGAEDDSKKLGTQLEITRLELLRKEDELRKLEKDLDDRKKLIEEKERRIRELEDLLRRQSEAVNVLKDKVANALLGFKDKGLTVEQRNGKVYVSMEAKLLFASGSWKVEPEGKDALMKLAKVLEEQKDLEILVEGHTDTDKLKSPNVPTDNWELSVLRATAVVKLMLENSRMDPKKITAAGRSEFIPVDEANKAKNRRIEVILIPNLDELFKIIGTGK